MDPKLQTQRPWAESYKGCCSGLWNHGKQLLPLNHSCLMPGAGAGSWGSLIQQAESKRVLRNELAPYGAVAWKQDPVWDQSAMEADRRRQQASSFRSALGQDLKFFLHQLRAVRGPGADATMGRSQAHCWGPRLSVPLNLRPQGCQAEAQGRLEAGGRRLAAPGISASRLGYLGLESGLLRRKGRWTISKKNVRALTGRFLSSFCCFQVLLQKYFLILPARPAPPSQALYSPARLMLLRAAALSVVMSAFTLELCVQRVATTDWVHVNSLACAWCLTSAPHS